ncbi:MAG: phosphatidate cytidylyltransferase [Oscillospiraceae bacterium]|nr:phosphatidate cytidylyltransferase [Oscillospiraceae bacterium]
MLKKVLSGVVGVAVGLLFLWIDRKEAFVIGVALISVGAVYEILVATKYIKNIALAAVSLAFVAAVPFVLNYDINHMRYIAFAFIIGLFTVMLFNHQKIKYAQLSLVAVVSLCIPFSLSCLAFIYTTLPEQHRLFIVLYTCVVTWVSDSGAYFAGTLFGKGKRKMAPVISPNKTWVGFAGGLVVAAVFGAGLGFGYEYLYNHYIMDNSASVMGEIKVNVWFLSAMAVPCAILGVLGDLSASILKRECAVKDFGKIMPGHGGFVDRFDSVLFSAPFAYLVFLQYVPIRFMWW